MRLSRAAKPKRSEGACAAAERRAIHKNGAAIPTSPMKASPARGARRRDRKVSDTDDLDDGAFARRIKNRINGYLTRIRREVQLVEAFTGEGWRKSKAGAVEATSEVARAEASLALLKDQVKASFAELEARYAGERPLTEHYTDSGLSEGDVVCSRCGISDTPVGNEILLCDGANCDRAYHQQCLRPAVPDSDAVEDPDVDWFCPCCDTKLDLLDAIREEFEGNADVEDWRDLFATGIGTVGCQSPGAKPAQADSGTMATSPVHTVNGTGGRPKAGTPQAAGQKAQRGREKDTPSSKLEVSPRSPRNKRRRRARTKVDYVALNAALFMGADNNSMAELEAADEDYEFVDEETTPRKAKRKPKMERAPKRKLSL